MDWQRQVGVPVLSPLTLRFRTKPANSDRACYCDYARTCKLLAFEPVVVVKPVKRPLIRLHPD